MSKLDLAVIGNCSISALLDERARIVWCCLPRFDGDPVFCSLMNDHRDGKKGFFDFIVCRLCDFEIQLDFLLHGIFHDVFYI